MIRRILFWLLLRTEGGDTMVAMFFAQRIIFGITEYKVVPATLREQVDAILTESGVEFLIEK